MAKKTNLSKAKSPVKSKVLIDYPREGEVVRPGHYAVRATAHGARQAQVRVDGGDWADCREALGHFWYDWAPQPGRAHLVVRARAGTGRWSLSGERTCVVTGGSERVGVA